MGQENGGLNMAETDMDVPTVAPVVGSCGVDREGATWGPFVPHKSVSGSYPFGLDPHEPGMVWTAGGRYLSLGKPDNYDIIAIIPAPDSVEPDATQETGVVVEVIHETVRVTHHDGAAFVEIAKGPEDGEAGTFTVHDSESFVQMPPAAAIAIARAILRMAGESK
jgi:hypothetical protein